MTDDTPKIISLQAARYIGLTRYFTGKPCKYGHVSDRMVSNRKCRKCLDIQKAIWASNNVDRRRAQKKKWDEDNREYVLKKGRQDYHADPDKFNARTKRWRDANPERLKESCRAWRDKNSDKHKALLKEWRKRNKEKSKIYRRNRRAKLRKSNGTHTIKEIEGIFSAQQGVCANSFCKKQLGSDFHADHIIPLILGGSNFATNIQLLCPFCNQSKGSKHPDEWMRLQTIKAYI